MDSGPSFASFGRRLAAFLIDVLPITAALFFLFYFTTHFGETVDRYFEQPRNIEVRRKFLEERNRIRDLSGAVYLLYAAVLESSRLRGTLGKRLCGIRVVSLASTRISFGRALTRNVTKMVSILPAFIGCLAMLWSKTRQAWHDRVAQTYVIIG